MLTLAMYLSLLNMDTVLLLIDMMFPRGSVDLDILGIEEVWSFLGFFLKAPFTLTICKKLASLFMTR
jgi:hypothetical protein